MNLEGLKCTIETFTQKFTLSCLFLLAILLVTLPSITTQPVDQLLVTFGTDVMFSVVATGDDLIYRWQKDDVDISNTAGAYMGTDTAMLTVLSVADPEDEGTYRVVVANAVGIITSNEAMLSIRECNNYSCMKKWYYTMLLP